MLFFVATALALLSSAPSASAANGKIVFKSGRNSTNGIWVMNPDGTGAASLIGNFSNNFNDPAWSPDGMKIAFAANRDGTTTHIYAMNADGTAITQVTNSPTAGDQAPAWSPDGTRIASWTNEGGIGLHIAVMRMALEEPDSPPPLLG